MTAPESSPALSLKPGVGLGVKRKVVVASAEIKPEGISMVLPAESRATGTVVVIAFPSVSKMVVATGIKVAGVTIGEAGRSLAGVGWPLTSRVESVFCAGISPGVPLESGDGESAGFDPMVRVPILNQLSSAGPPVEN